MNDIILMNDIHLSMDGREILQGVSVSVKKGEVVTIMGPNGAGKTTLLKVALGLIKPTAGQLYVFGERKVSKKGLLGYIPQNFGLVNGLSVLSNVMIGALHRMPRFGPMLGFYPKDVLDEAYGIMERLNIDHLVHTKVGKLSGGERQRVAIARTMLQKPSIIFADEMAASLDLKAAHEVMDNFLDIRKEMGLTLIMTHHNPEFAEMYSEITHLMMNGKIVSSIPASSFNKDNLIKMYGLEAA